MDEAEMLKIVLRTNGFFMVGILAGLIIQRIFK